MAKKALHEQLDPELWMVRFHEDFARETDRACVVLAGAMVESALADALGHRLVTGSQEGRFVPFTTKINMCHQVGLVTRRFRDDLHRIAAIRNHFAHGVLDATFVDAKVRSELDALSASCEAVVTEPHHVERFGSSPRARFQMCVGWMLFQLGKTLKDIQRIQEPRIEFGYTYGPQYWDPPPTGSG